ncbi:BCCT family transporter [Halorhodospira halochloris]|uniref:BCCT family transporter n=1 Tax=Halorhodospira halochloris TaxID=1052 RepID=UPI003B75CD52
MSDHNSQKPDQNGQAHDQIAALEREYDTRSHLDDQNIKPLGLELHNPVFVVSSLLIIVFVIGALIFTDPAADDGGMAKVALDAALEFSRVNFDWLFLIAGNIFVIFCLLLIVLPVGKVRIGGPDAKPDFSVLSWFAMLFAAGMGIGLMFWSVAEPVAFYTDWWGTPLNVEAETEQGARAALGATIYHWGLHPWAIYGIMALALAFFAYNKGLPMTVRSAFYPLLGERTWGPIGHIIDLLAVLATVFGLATSLGLGAQQAASGLSYIFTGVPNTLATQIAVIVAVTSIALISVLRGIDRGIKILSNINISIAGLLMLYIIVNAGAIAFAGYVYTTGTGYLETFLPLSNPVGREDTKFLHDWTVFYWAWWISWSPFVGMFIARVSRGRSVREFMTAVLIVPTAVTIFWIAAFGGTGVEQAREGIGNLAAGLGDDESMALFHMLNELPLAMLTSAIGVFLVLIFFVTSSDSGSLVIDSITSGGKTNAPEVQRIYWVILQGLIAGTLLYAGGDAALEALQSGAVTAGLPFTVVLLLICASLFLGLRHEQKLLRLKGKI